MVSPADRERLVRYLSCYCRGRANRLKQPALAEALGFDVRHLQAVISAEGQGNPHIGTGCGRWSGVWWSVDLEDHRIARRSLVGRLAPVAGRVRCIDRALPELAQDGLGFDA
jgi:hypothetical protein